MKVVLTWLRARPGAVLGAIALLALLMRLPLTARARHPGHGDPSFYYAVATNIAAGRGFVVDFVWHYLTKPDQITHTSNDYWMPLAEAIIALPLLAFPGSLFAATLPSMIAASALACVAYLFARLMSHGDGVALASALLVAVLPSLFLYSLLTESAIFYALFASAALLSMIHGRSQPRFFWPAGFLVGLSHATRGDGILLLPVLGAAILMAPASRRTRALLLAQSLATYALVLAPVVVSNLRLLGTPFPEGPFKTMFMREYEDLFSYSKELSLSTYLDWGAGNMARSKFYQLTENLRRLHASLDSTLTIFGLLGCAHVVTSLRRPGPDRVRALGAVPPLAFLALLYLFYTFVATFPSDGGGFKRSSTAALPFVVVLATGALAQSLRSRSTFGAVVLILAALLLRQSMHDGKRAMDDNRSLGRELATIRGVIEADSPGERLHPAVIMTRDPWEVHVATGLPTIQIPNEGLDVIHAVAQRYGATYLLLPAPRKALSPIARGTVHDPRFELRHSFPNSRLKLFRIRG